MFCWLEVPHITQCRILIAQGSEASLQDAGEKLTLFRKTTEAQNNIPLLIDILLLKTLIYQKKSQSDKALATLTRAISLAESGGFVRPFLELGPEMAKLLVRFSQRGVALGHVTRILAAFPDEMKDEIPLQVVDGADLSTVGNLAQSPSSPLIEPLTPRELDVLALIAQGLTNKEIAQQLVITHGTVRQHAYNLYQKLQVNTRQQAIMKAADLGVLLPE